MHAHWHYIDSGSVQEVWEYLYVGYDTIVFFTHWIPHGTPLVY